MTTGLCSKFWERNRGLKFCNPRWDEELPFPIQKKNWGLTFFQDVDGILKVLSGMGWLFLFSRFPI